MKLTEDEIISNYDKLIKFINENFNNTDRANQLKKIYTNDVFVDRLLYAPASSKEYYHNCFPGGYIIHILNVIKFAQELDKLWVDIMENKRTYTYEELLFVALNHDLGKLGDKNEELYITHDIRWKKERGELYDFNSNINHMKVEDRTLFLLQQYDIKVTLNEYLAIKLHDGLYDDSNRDYLINWSDAKKLKTDLPIILHHADMMSTMMEYRNWKNNEISQQTKKKIKNKSVKQTNIKGVIKNTDLINSFFNKK